MLDHLVGVVPSQRTFEFVRESLVGHVPTRRQMRFRERSLFQVRNANSSSCATLSQRASGVQRTLQDRWAIAAFPPIPAIDQRSSVRIQEGSLEIRLRQARRPVLPVDRKQNEQEGDEADQVDRSSLFRRNACQGQDRLPCVQAMRMQSRRSGRARRASAASSAGRTAHR